MKKIGRKRMLAVCLAIVMAFSMCSLTPVTCIVKAEGELAIINITDETTGSDIAKLIETNAMKEQDSVYEYKLQINKVDAQSNETFKNAKGKSFQEILDEIKTSLYPTEAELKSGKTESYSIVYNSTASQLSVTRYEITGIADGAQMLSDSDYYSGIKRSAYNQSGKIDMAGEHWDAPGTEIRNGKNCVLYRLLDKSGAQLALYYCIRYPVKDGTAGATMIADQYYSGQEIKPMPKVVLGSNPIDETDQFRYEYKNNVNAGTATVRIYGDGVHYTGAVETDFKIQKSFGQLKKGEAIPNRVYTGKEITIEPEDIANKMVGISGEILKYGTDYKIEDYENNINVGTATVHFTILNDNYAGCRDVNFSILPSDFANNGVVVTDIEKQKYTGNQIKPDVTVTVGDTTLIKDKDYTLSYGDNLYTSGTVTITGKGNYTGTINKEFTISPITFEECQMTVEDIADQTFTGNQITPDVVVKAGDVTLVKDVDYSVAYGENIHNKGTVTITGKNGYTGTITKDFTIVPADFNTLPITVSDIADQTFTGNQITPEVVVKVGDTTLVKDVDYSVAYGENIHNSGTITIAGKGDYKGVITKTFTIAPLQLEQLQLTVSKIPEQTFTGKQIMPEITVKAGNTVFVKDVDYSLTYGENLNKSGTIKIEGKGDYTGVITIAFVIRNPVATQPTTEVPTLDISKDTIVQKNDKDVSGSNFQLLRLVAGKSTKNANCICWKKVKGADGYMIYGNQCGIKNKYKKMAVVSKKSTKFNHKNLKTNTYYKYFVVAYKKVKGKYKPLVVSKTVHIVTAGGNKGNAKKVEVNKSKRSLTVGDTFTIKAKEINTSEKIHIHRAIAFESSNSYIASVNKKGVVTGKKAGSCIIYAYAQNGVSKKIRITVKDTSTK